MGRREDEIWRRYERDIIHNVSDMVLYYDAEGNIINWNLRAIRELGYDSKTLHTMNITDIFPNDYIIEGQRVQIVGKQEQRETVAYRRNQTCFPVRLKVLLLSEGGGKGYCIGRSIEEKVDLTKEVERLRKEVESVNEMKTQIIANITHELRTPLNGMKGLLMLLKLGNLDEEDKENIDVVLNCCENMEHMVNEMLDFSKMQVGKLELEEKTFDFSDWIKKIIRLHKTMISQKGIQFSVNIKPNIPSKLVGDEHRLSQILHNLLNNAIKFTESGTISLEITLSSEKTREVELFFVVRDSGIGIKKEDKEKLFQSFTQVDASITRRFGGTGLGLAISKALVEQMQGTIGVASEEGKGSEFYFTVWLKRQEKTEATLINDESYTSYEEVEEEWNTNMNTTTAKKEGIVEISITLLKQVKVSLELGSWNKAEEIAEEMRNNVKPWNEEYAKKTLRLLLSIRKRNIEKCQKNILELQKMLDDVNVS